MRPIDGTLCLRCEDKEPVLGSSFCPSCSEALSKISSKPAQIKPSQPATK